MSEKIAFIGVGNMGNPMAENLLKAGNKIKVFDVSKDMLAKAKKKNLETTLLIEPDNEEAILMLMKIALEKSNYSKVKDLSNTFTKVCKKLCDDNKDILETLANIEPKNDS